ncbi:MAG TPA: hypothetical protein VIV12_12965, partial [Streptosporangiaceae bacterium]
RPPSLPGAVPLKRRLTRARSLARAHSPPGAHSPRWEAGPLRTFSPPGAPSHQAVGVQPEAQNGPRALSPL